MGVGFDCCSSFYEDHPIVIVVSPLVQLMSSQVADLRKMGLSAAVLTNMEDEEQLKCGSFDIVIGSPEAWLGEKGRQLLLSEVYQKNVCLVATDEVHVIPRWGFESEKKKAFRLAFGQLGALRSLVRQGVPFMALTATASRRTQQKVMKTLNMKKPHKIVRSPCRANIKLVVHKVDKSLETTFAWLVMELRTYKQTMPKVLIYCKSVKECADIYAMLLAELGQDGRVDSSKPPSSHNRLFAMFFHSTPDDKKQLIANDLQKVDGNYRVVVCTNALGMGIDLKDINLVINYGCPRDIESYIQESGRAGRSGQSSMAILYYSSMHLLGTDAEVKLYARNSSECRRKLLYRDFGGNFEDSGHHSCCDICARSCVCDGDSCSYVPQTCEAPPPKMVEPDAAVREVSDGERHVLKNCLLEFQSNLGKDSEYLDLFNINVINDIVDKAAFVDSYDFVMNKTSIVHPSHALEILKIFEEVFDEKFEITDEIQADCKEAEVYPEWEDRAVTLSDSDSSVDSDIDILEECSTEEL
ncbi:ATP-dependent DNA helicase hus2/rqh1 [Lingula anatina]|uniref:DNA 3'-5' helicase n=1 Tax=Lingula anatina TaxID=7574 RepID=A0A2R2MJ94_LINAN|nr:ATP-dependent DNA helicase hus2/rqh1 [Lingula anatina]|eukprot:XP_023930264.1 ATP-dependent DNA helicase hus2/rqh1 [Lingula anatina]